MAENAKILIIDDEQGIRDMLLKGLTAYGYKVAAVADAEEGIERIKKENYDIVICDIKMPKMQGVEALGIIKKIRPMTEVIMVTGFGDISIALECMKNNAYDFVKKPIDFYKLIFSIERAIEKTHIKSTVALYEAVENIFSELNPDEVYSLIIDSTLKIVKGDAVSLMLLDEDEKLYIAASRGLSEEIKQSTKLAVGKLVAEKHKSMKGPVIISGESSLQLHGIKEKKDFKFFIAAPIIGKKKLLGVLNIYRIANSEEFSVNDMRHITIFSRQISKTIDNSHLYKELELELAEVQKLQSQLIQTEKLAAVGEMAASIVHQVKNPLSVINNSIELCFDDSTINKEIKEYLQIVLESAGKINRMITDLLHLAKPVELNFQLISVLEMLDSIINSVRTQIASKKISIVTKYEKSVPGIYADKNVLGEVFFNIIDNAIESMSDGGVLTVQVLFESHEKIVIKFMDTGKGISKENLSRIFNPFFTTKRNGTGLGLAIATKIIALHKGNITAESKADKGSSFIITLPVNK